MTRELSHKTAATLLRNAFASKGAALSHTEALDILARLKGFNAWSHLQQTSKTEPAAAPVGLAPVKMGQHSIVQALSQYYGKNGECPYYPRETWQAQAPHQDYWEWVVSCAISNGTWKGPVEFLTSPAVEVTLSNGKKAMWNIENNLTDRWGELNDAYWQYKPGVAILSIDTALYEKLQSQMWDELSFIVRKDGKFGLLFETEVPCHESESENGGDSEGLPLRAVVEERLRSTMAALEKTYPQVQFCIPDPAEIYYERASIWAFYELDSLTAEQRKALGMTLLGF